MKNILIFLLFSVTLSAQVDKVVKTNPFTTASGDLRGTYPSPKVGLGVVGNNNITTGLRDSIQRFRKDTTIQVVNTTLNMGSQANLYGKFNRVYVFANSYGGNTVQVNLPSAADTLKNTEFIVRHLAGDGTNTTCIIASFDGFAIAYTSTGYTYEPTIAVKDRRVLFTKPFKVGDSWYWEQSILNYSYAAITADALGITSLTGAITGSGSGAVATTLSSNIVTSANIVNSTITALDIASQAVETANLKDGNVTNIKMADDAITSIKVLDNSLTGSDLTYLTLRAGTASAASLQLTSGVDKTTLTGGELLYNGSRFAVGVGSAKRRIALTNDASPTNGQIPIGNGTDYTNTTITAGNQIIVTNGVGTITVATYPKRDTTVSYDNIDYTLLTTGLTGTQVNTRYNNIWITGRVPSTGVTSDALLFLPSPLADYNQTTIYLYSVDQNTTYNIGISAPTNSVMLGNGTYTNAYPVNIVAGQLITIRCVIDPIDSSYKWIFR
jgi:hypothetical protein